MKTKSNTPKKWDFNKREWKNIGCYLLSVIFVVAVYFFVNAIILSSYWCNHSIDDVGFSKLIGAAKEAIIASNFWPFIPPLLVVFFILLCIPLYFCLFYQKQQKSENEKIKLGCAIILYFIGTSVLLIYSAKHLTGGLQVKGVYAGYFLLWYIGTIDMFFLGILPIFLIDRLKGIQFSLSDEQKHWYTRPLNAFLMSLKCYSRLVPLAYNIFIEKINVVICGFIVNAVSVILFMLVMVFGIGMHKKDINEMMVLRIYGVIYVSMLTSLVVVVSQFYFGFYINLQKTIEDTYKRKLRKIIDNLDKHVIILGFGELGKKTLKEVLRIKGMDKPENLMIPNSTLDFVDVSKNFLIVDKNEQLFQYPQPKSSDLKMGIVKIKNPRKDKIFSPVIIGDINLPSTLDHVNKSRAELIFNVAMDEMSTFKLLSQQKQQNKNKKGNMQTFVYSFYRASDKSFLVSSGLEPNTFFMYPPQISGTKLGNILYSFYRKRKDPINLDNYIKYELPKHCDQTQISGTELRNIVYPFYRKKEEDRHFRTLIVGDRKQIFFVLESLWLAIKNHLEDEGNAKKFFETNVRMFADSDYLEEHLLVKKENGKKEYFLQFAIPRSIEQVSNSIKEDHDHSYIEIPSIKGSSTNLIDLEKEMEEFKPNYILSCLEDGKKTMNFLHELLVVAERKKWLDKEVDKLPCLIVSTRDNVQGHIRDIMFYWAHSDMHEGKGALYPRQYPDAIVGYYEGIEGMISGVAKSMEKQSDKTLKSDKTPKFEASICVNNVAGFTSRFLAWIADMSVDPIDPKTEMEYEKIKIPSFMNFEVRPMANDRWCFNARAKLVSASSLHDDPKGFSLNKLRSYLINAASKDKDENNAASKDKDENNCTKVEKIFGKYACKAKINERDACKAKINGKKQLRCKKRKADEIIQSIKVHKEKFPWRETTDKCPAKEICPKYKECKPHAYRAKDNCKMLNWESLCENIRTTIENMRDNEMPAECPGRQVCPMYTYSRRFKTDNGRIENIESISKQKSDKGETKTIHGKVNKKLNEDRKNIKETRDIYWACPINLPLNIEEPANEIADIVLCCHGNRPGNLATALNRLLLRKTKPKPREESKEEVVNISYIQSYVCYDNRFKYHKIIGNIETVDAKKTETAVEENSIYALLIQPITEHNKWLNYAKQLQNFFNECGNKSSNKGSFDYKLYYHYKEDYDSDKDKNAGSNDKVPVRILLIKNDLVTKCPENLEKCSKKEKDCKECLVVGSKFEFEKNDSLFNVVDGKRHRFCDAGKGDCKLLDYLRNYSRIYWKEHQPEGGSGNKD